MALPYPGMSFTAFATLPAADLNKLVSNIEALANGTAFAAGAIPHAAVASGYPSNKVSSSCAFWATLTSAPTLNGSFQKLTLGAENFDVGSNYNTGTSRFVAPVTGIYSVSWSAYIITGSKLLTAVYKNGVEIMRGTWVADGASFLISNGARTIKLTAADYLELYALSTGSGSVAGADLSGHLVGLG